MKSSTYDDSSGMPATPEKALCGSVSAKKRLALLERAFSCEIEAALDKTPHVMQTRSIKAADALVAEGLLAKRSIKWGAGVFAMTIEGYELTHAGRLIYCSTCAGDGDALA
jgi:hypothetical protein